MKQSKKYLKKAAKHIDKIEKNEEVFNEQSEYKLAEFYMELSRLALNVERN